MNAGLPAPDPTVVDAFKGILISLIVLGHNTHFSAAYPFGFNFIYDFHVACFLLLPFIRPVSPKSWAAIKDRMTRYFVPHFVFFTFACLLYFLFIVPKDFHAITEWLESVVVAIVLSNQDRYKEACGFGLFWFIPAFFVIIILMEAFFKLRSQAQIKIMFGLLFLNLLIGLIPRSVDFYNILFYKIPIPFSLPLVLFLFPLGIIVNKLWSLFGSKYWFYLGCFCIFFAIFYLTKLNTNNYGITNNKELDLIKVLNVLSYDIYIISAFFMIFGVAHILKFGLFSFIGSRSLFIFLLHSFIWQFIVQTGLARRLAAWAPSIWLAVVVSFLLTMAITLGICLLVERRQRLYRLIFPRSWPDWKSAVGW